MRNLILVGALALLVLSPLTAAAQQRAAPAPAAPALVVQAIDGLPLNKLLVIGVGAILGAATTQAILGGEVVALVGGVAGGLLGAWWYDNGSSVRVAMRAPAGAPALVRAERLALAR